MTYDKVKLVAVCDIVEERAKKAAEEYRCKYYLDYKEMLEKEKIDCVHICLPHWLHDKVAVYCLKKNINVILEKPLAATVKGGEAIIKAAAKSKANIGICFQNRYNNASIRLKEIVEEGKLGNIQCARGFVTWSKDDSYYTDSDWKGKWKTEGGGVLINQAIHTLDLMQWLMGDVTDVSGHAFNDRFPFIEVEDTATINLNFANGTRGIFYATNTYKANSLIVLEIHGDAGNAIIRGSTLEVTYKDGTTEHVTKDSSIPNPGHEYWGTAHTKLICDFYDHIKEKPFWISPEEAMKTLSIIKKVYSQSQIEK